MRRRQLPYLDHSIKVTAPNSRQSFTEVDVEHQGFEVVHVVLKGVRICLVSEACPSPPGPVPCCLRLQCLLPSVPGIWPPPLFLGPRVVTWRVLPHLRHHGRKIGARYLALTSPNTLKSRTNKDDPTSPRPTNPLVLHRCTRAFCPRRPLRLVSVVVL